jgi:predicted amidohydrolase
VLTSSEEPAVTALRSATPNPFNPTTVIGYELEEQAYATLTVYDVTGRLVATLVEGELPGGRHNATWEAQGVPSGVYFCRLTVGDFSETRKMVLLK